MFIKHEGEEWIVHGLFVDDMIHASTSDDLRDQFISECQADFDMTSSFLGMEIEQKGSHYSFGYIRPGGPSRVQGNGLRVPQAEAGANTTWNYLELGNCSQSPDLVKQKVYRSFVAKMQFAASWVRCDIAFTASQSARFCAFAGP